MIQFDGPFQSAWQDQLRANGVELLHYVPEDAFLARFNNVNPGELKKLPFVHWTAKYKPEHKLYHRVAQAAAQNKAGEVVNVSILVSSVATAGEVADVKRLLRTLRQESKLHFGTVLRGGVPSGQIATLAQSEAVLWIEPDFKPKLVDEVASKIVAGDGGTNRTTMQVIGYDGLGVTVAVADSGLHTGNAATMHPDLMGRVSGFFFYGELTDASDEHSHGTHVTGIIAGNGATGEMDENFALYGLGVAPRANVIAQRIFDGEGNYEAPPSFEVLTHDAVRAGADIGSNSWGDDTQGRYDMSAMEFDALVRDADNGTAGDQPYILEFSAGNAGPGTQTIGSPAVAKNVIASGASENDRPDFFLYADGIDTMADFSSRGPCEDGRIKPDVVAPGTWISSLRSPLGNDEFAWADISFYYLYQGGTSQAGPHVSGAAADFVQYYSQTAHNKPSPALVKAALINSATDMDNLVETGPVPNMDEGWGRVDLTNLIGSPRSYLFVDQTQLLRTGQTYEQHIAVASRGEPLKITMAYTDFPGFPGVIPALVNDLDLEVEGPGGEIYLGNQFDEGESVAGSAAPDRFNNVEAVHLSEPEPGEYIVRVRARNVVRDSRRDTPQVDQDFALVISADLAPPGTPILFLDRPAYTAPSEIRIKLIDSVLGSSNATVTVQSTTEGTAEPVILRAATSGSFTGRIATATGPAAIDGRLQIAHGDQIQVSFTDAVNQRTATATAVGDLLPPVISNIFVTNSLGRTLITWDTDEPATSLVRFGTNSSLTSAVTNLSRVQSHEVFLDDLRPGTVYYFLVNSADAAGNSATNNNGGALFSFTAVGAPTVLLVDAYEDDGATTVVPLSIYTDALNAIGTSYAVWDVASQANTPSIADLRPFKVVMWRFSDSFLTASTFSSGDQTAIRQYLAGGGAFFLSSMEQLTRVPASFFHEVLHVQGTNVDAGVSEILGATGNPYTVGVDIPLDYSYYDDDVHDLFGVPPDISDTFTPATDAAPLLVDATTRQIAGLMYPRIGQVSTGRVVFLSFPLDAVPLAGTAPNSRIELMRTVINFLAPGQNGVNQINFDSPEYTLPSLVTVELGAAGLAGAGRAAVNVYSDSVTNRIPLTLAETIPLGLFHGSITMTNTGSSVTNQLQARNGDRIRVEYFDQASFSSVTATARVDTIAPLISDIAVETNYVDATISWSTSEDADSLVQFGESTFLGRTGYDAALNTVHEVIITGLLPDHDYYYQVTSRDIAGNAVTSELRLLRTLKPVSPPYSDNFDSAPGKWDSFTGDASSTTWTLGVPHNGVAAHSAPNSWCSSINGAPSDGIDTFLISPAIDLTGASEAKLTFWHYYDFTDPTGDDVYQEGAVLIFTNQLTDPAVLMEYIDDSGGWVPEEFDLSAYVGNVVNIVWYHTLLSFEKAPRVGWLMDDLSVTATLLPPSLQIDRAGTNVVISWPSDPAGWYLVSKPLLTTAPSWSSVTNLPILSDGRYFVTNAPLGIARFYQLSQSAGSPSLSISTTATSVTLAWPTNAAGYALEWSDLVTPLRWNSVTDPQPSANGNMQSVTLSRSAAARFFRLRSPQ